MKDNVFKNALTTYVILILIGLIQMASTNVLSSDVFVLAGQILGRPSVPFISSFIFGKLIKGLSEKKQLVLMLVVGILSMLVFPSLFVLVVVLLLGFIDLIIGFFRKKDK